MFCFTQLNTEQLNTHSMRIINTYKGSCPKDDTDSKMLFKKTRNYTQWLLDYSMVSIHSKHLSVHSSCNNSLYSF